MEEGMIFAALSVLVPLLFSSHKNTSDVVQIGAFPLSIITIAFWSIKAVKEIVKNLQRSISHIKERCEMHLSF